MAVPKSARAEVTDPRVERLVLRHLEGRPLSRAELVSRTRATDHQVQAVLDELVGTSHVIRRPQDIGPADYELTPAGVERLAQVGRSTASPVPVAKRPTVAKRRPPQRRPKALVLTADEWGLCSEALTRNFVLGRIGREQMARRTDLLYRARTRDDLAVVFEGLPMPHLPTPVRRPVPATTAPAPRTPRFEAEPKPVDRELIVNLSKSLVVGMVFAVIIILSDASVTLLLVDLVVTAGNMFLSYRSWADKRRSR
ncbi:DUF1707 SHOCT-like domain-containing protein [Kribbella sp. CA-245084]|uniref:DUF1707 SHOCT-like domain-containing protein n=1 Tax=Kribbella sp. CA-245084 TaxID=3239940 RepID=UPI003D8E806E